MGWINGATYKNLFGTLFQVRKESGVYEFCNYGTPYWRKIYNQKGPEGSVLVESSIKDIPLSERIK